VNTLTHFQEQIHHIFGGPPPLKNYHLNRLYFTDPKEALTGRFLLDGAFDTHDTKILLLLEFGPTSQIEIQGFPAGPSTFEIAELNRERFRLALKGSGWNVAILTDSISVVSSKNVSDDALHDRFTLIPWAR